MMSAALDQAPPPSTRALPDQPAVPQRVVTNPAGVIVAPADWGQAFPFSELLRDARRTGCTPQRRESNPAGSSASWHCRLEQRRTSNNSEKRKA